MIICSYGCGKKAKYFFKNKKGCCEKSPNKCSWKIKIDSEKKKGKPFKGIQPWKMSGYTPSIPWNKGKVGIYSKEYRKKISKGLVGKCKGFASTPEKEIERCKNISKSLKLNPKSGGLRRGSGRGKRGWYKGYWCDSSWELAWVIYNIEHNINFKRNELGFEYIFNGIKKKYYPDFIIENTFYEIKGRRSYNDLDEITKEKINQFNGNLEVLYEKQMKKFIDYVINKYGKNFSKLYKKK